MVYRDQKRTTLLRLILTFQNSHVRVYVSLIVSGEGRQKLISWNDAQLHRLAGGNLLTFFLAYHLPSGILSDISSDVSCDLAYLLTFLLTFRLTLFLAHLVVFFLTDLLAYLVTFFLTFFRAYLVTFFLSFLLTFFRAYLLTFCLTYLLTFFRAYCLTFCLAYLLAILWHSFWRPDILSDILSDTLSGILAGISRHSVWQISWYSFWDIFWHSFWHIFWHSVWYSFWLTFFLTFYLAVEARQGTLSTDGRGGLTGWSRFPVSSLGRLFKDPLVVTGTLSEWLRRWNRNPLGSACKGLKPLGVAMPWLRTTNDAARHCFFSFLTCVLFLLHFSVCSFLCACFFFLLSFFLYAYSSLLSSVSAPVLFPHIQEVGLVNVCRGLFLSGMMSCSGAMSLPPVTRVEPRYDALPTLGLLHWTPRDSYPAWEAARKKARSMIRGDTLAGNLITARISQGSGPSAKKKAVKQACSAVCRRQLPLLQSGDRGAVVRAAGYSKYKNSWINMNLRNMFTAALSFTSFRKQILMDRLVVSTGGFLPAVGYSTHLRDLHPSICEKKSQNHAHLITKKIQPLQSGDQRRCGRCRSAGPLVQIHALWSRGDAGCKKPASF